MFSSKWKLATKETIGEGLFRGHSNLIPCLSHQGKKPLKSYRMFARGTQKWRPCLWISKNLGVDSPHSFQPSFFSKTGSYSDPWKEPNPVRRALKFSGFVGVQLHGSIFVENVLTIAKITKKMFFVLKSMTSCWPGLSDVSETRLRPSPTSKACLKQA